MTATARYWQSRFAPQSDDPDFAADIAAIREALAQGHTLAHRQVPAIADGRLRISLDQALNGDIAPVVSEGDQRWLYRIFRAEADLARHLIIRLGRLAANIDPSPFLQGLRPAQQQAVLHGLTHRLTLINGGPGTGKTYTVARLVAAIRAENPDIRLALAAPTGKAAQRMSESLAAALGSSHDAQTLHRLLGIGSHGQPQYHAERRLPYDLILIDEASMLSLELARALFAAAAPESRLILLGDADQLAAVEPGAVLHDLARHPLLAPYIVTLTDSQRFAGDSGIGRLAAAVLAGDHDAADTLLGEHPDLARHASASHEALFAPYVPYLQALRDNASIESCFAAFAHYRILCAGRHGALGVTAINRAMRLAHLRALQRPAHSAWYHGQPLIVTRNDYANQLYNGDIGLCLQSGDDLRLHLPDREPLPLSRLNPAHLDSAYAMTIHKSQGSEFDHVALAFDPASRAFASRELLYTGITRARRRLDIYAARATLAHAVATPTRRSTGLDILLSRLAPTGKGHQPALL